RAEHEARLALDDAQVQVRDRHRRRTDRSLAVDLRLVARDDLRVRSAQELARDREAAVAADLLDARALQQRQRRAARPDEDEARGRLRRCAADLIADLQAPVAVLQPLQARHTLLRAQARPALDEPVHELLRLRAE